jgi:hypothetical protein
MRAIIVTLTFALCIHGASAQEFCNILARITNETRDGFRKLVDHNHIESNGIGSESNITLPGADHGCGIIIRNGIFVCKWGKNSTGDLKTQAFNLAKSVRKCYPNSKFSYEDEVYSIIYKELEITIQIEQFDKSIILGVDKPFPFEKQ